MTQDKEK